MRPVFPPSLITESDIDVLLSDLAELYGYDFTYYSRDSLRRRVNRLVKLEKYPSFAEFRNKVRSDPDYISHLIDRITVNVTEMFRDSIFFKELRERVIPKLAEFPEIKVWHAGCSSGEEAYSVAILLHEAGLLERSTIYATDINHKVLAKAGRGIFPFSLMQLYAENYARSGGTENFASYYTTTPDGGLLDERFSSKIRFRWHNLASLEFLGKFQLVVCRNVVIYLDKELREKVFGLFDLSTAPGSHLALGEKETIRFSRIDHKFIQDGQAKVWRKVN